MSDFANCNYGLRNFYKGKFLKYVDDNYLDSNNLDAYIEIPELMLNSGSTDISLQTTNPLCIQNLSELSIESTVQTMTAIICRPLYVNHFYPYLKGNETVFVFMIDDDIKKLFYISCTNDQPPTDAYEIRRGHNLIYIDKDEIKLTREKGDDKNDTSLIINKEGININCENFMINGHNYIDDVFNKN